MYFGFDKLYRTGHSLADSGNFLTFIWMQGNSFHENKIRRVTTELTVQYVRVKRLKVTVARASLLITTELADSPRAYCFTLITACVLLEERRIQKTKD